MTTKAVITDQVFEFKTDDTTPAVKIIATASSLTFEGPSNAVVQLKNIKIPVDDNDAANKTYVDGLAAGIETKESVVCAASTNQAGTYFNGAGSDPGLGATVTYTTTGTTTIDGVTLTTGIRVILTGQTDKKENGVYIVTTAGSGGTATVLTRATDFDDASAFFGGEFVFTEQGGTYSNTGWTGKNNVSTSAISGTVTVAKSSTALTGSGTSFNSLAVGQGLQVDGEDMILATITDNSNAVLKYGANVAHTASTAYAGPVIGTTLLDFNQFSSAGAMVAGDGLVKTGTTFAANPDTTNSTTPAGGGTALGTIVVVSDQLQVGVVPITKLQHNTISGIALGTNLTSFGIAVPTPTPSMAGGVTSTSARGLLITHGSTTTYNGSGQITTTLELPQDLKATGDVTFNSLDLTTNASAAIFKFKGSSLGVIDMKAPATVNGTGNAHTLVLPADSAAGFLKNDGAGALEWSGSNSGVHTLAAGTLGVTRTRTVGASDYDGSISVTDTIDLVQDLNIASTVAKFAQLELTTHLDSAKLKIKGSSSSNHVSILAHASTTNYTITLPAASTATANSVLVVDGSANGQLSWSAGLANRYTANAGVNGLTITSVLTSDGTTPSNMYYDGAIALTHKFELPQDLKATSTTVAFAELTATTNIDTKSMILQDDDASHAVTLKAAGTTTAAYTIRFPAAAPTANQLLQVGTPSGAVFPTSWTDGLTGSHTIQVGSSADAATSAFGLTLSNPTNDFDGSANLVHQIELPQDLKTSAAAVFASTEIGTLKLKGVNSPNNLVTITSDPSTAAMTIILPAAAGTANQILSHSGAGNKLIWSDGLGGAHTIQAGATPNAATSAFGLTITNPTTDFDGSAALTHAIELPQNLQRDATTTEFGKLGIGYGTATTAESALCVSGQLVGNSPVNMTQFAIQMGKTAAGNSSKIFIPSSSSGTGELIFALYDTSTNAGVNSGSGKIKYAHSSNELQFFTNAIKCGFFAASSSGNPGSFTAEAKVKATGVQINSSSGSRNITLTTSATTTSHGYEFPTAAPTATGQFLIPSNIADNAAIKLAWQSGFGSTNVYKVTVGGSAVSSSSPVVSTNGLSLTESSAATQYNGTAAVTHDLELPQPLKTSSSVTFADLLCSTHIRSVKHDIRASGNTNDVSLKANATSAAYDVVFPAAKYTAVNQIMRVNSATSGQMEWSSGMGSTIKATVGDVSIAAVNTYVESANGLKLKETAGVVAGYDGSATIIYDYELPQGLKTTSSPEFVQVTTTSDAKLKRNIYPVVSALEKVLKLKPSYFHWKNFSSDVDTTKRNVGLIAQDVQKVLPEAVTDNGRLSLDYNALVSVLVAGVKELSARVAELEGSRGASSS